jgi:hypothetical protein
MMVVDNKEEVDGIIDPGSQIIAMSEVVCHDIGLAYEKSAPSPYISRSTSYGLQPTTYY